MPPKYRPFQRAEGVFYWQENRTSNRGSLRTKDRPEAQRLLVAMNEGHRQPVLNLALGRAYLAAHDPKMSSRTWGEVMDEMSRHGLPTTQRRCARAMRSRAYDSIRKKPLVETTAADRLAICHANGNSVGR